MTGLPITVTGNLTGDPELRYTPAGLPVASFSVAVTDRVLDKATNTWSDGNTSFWRCTVWRDQAENVAASAHKGDRVTVVGTISQRTYEKDGDKRTVAEVNADEVSVSLRYAVASVKRASRAALAAVPATA